MANQYESKILFGNTTYWKFYRDSTPQTFMNAFEEFKSTVELPHINRLIVDVEMGNAWDKATQDLWIQTGKLADASGIKKWGVRTIDILKRPTINYLIKGAGEPRNYECKVSQDLNEIYEWVQTPTADEVEA